MDRRRTLASVSKGQADNELTAQLSVAGDMRLGSFTACTTSRNPGSRDAARGALCGGGGGVATLLVFFLALLVFLVFLLILFLRLLCLLGRVPAPAVG